MRGNEFLGVDATGPIVEGLLAASVSSGRGGGLAGGDGFASLLSRPATKRKKVPVLILDPEEAMAAASEIQRIAAEDFANIDPAAREEVRVVFAAMDWAGESAACSDAEDLADPEDLAEPETDFAEPFAAAFDEPAFDEPAADASAFDVSAFAGRPLDEPVDAEAAWPEDIWAQDVWIEEALADGAVPAPECDLPECEVPDWPVTAEEARIDAALAAGEAVTAAEEAEADVPDLPDLPDLAEPEPAAELREWDMGDAWPERQEAVEAVPVDQIEEPIVQPAAVSRPASGHRLRAGLAPAFQPDEPLARLSLTVRRLAIVVRWMRHAVRRWF